jgi:surface carbohydrate biosynthesis protein
MNILLPVEISNRELLSKLFLASKFAKRGYTSYVGDKHSILRLSKYIDSGIYFDKGFHKGVSNKIYSRLKERQISIVSLDEENAVDYSDFQQINNRFPNDILDEFSFIFLWGEKQFNFLKDNKSNFNKSKTFVTGHPRFEILKNEFQYFYQDKSEKIKSEFGEFVLINTNFSLGNNIKGDQHSYNNYVDRFPQIKKIIKYQKKQIDNFIELCKELSKSQQLNIVLRPHPEECIQVYKDSLKDYSSVHIIYDDSVIPWIIASKYMIHHDCTTSIEAAMLGKSSIAFIKDFEETLTTDIPIRISHQFKKMSELVECINNNNIEESFIDKSILREYFHFDNNSTNDIVERVISKFTPTIKDNKLRLYKTVSILRIIRSYFVKKKNILHEYKISGFNEKNLKRYLGLINLHSNNKIKYTKIDQYLYKITRD